MSKERTLRSSIEYPLEHIWRDHNGRRWRIVERAEVEGPERWRDRMVRV